MKNISSVLLLNVFLALGLMAEYTNIFESGEESVSRSGVKIYTLQDEGQNSVSFAQAAIKNSLDSSENIRRILSLDGGGIRGLYEIAALAVLEEILIDNGHERISDVFDVAGGTSTGSILAAGLFYEGPDKKRYSAVDLLKLYAHFGYKIFDSHKRITKGVLGAKYSAEGVDELLRIHFGADKLTHMVLDEQNNPKPVFVVGFDASEQKPVVFSTYPLDDPQEAKYGYHDRYLVEAIGVSTAAPVYFPARDIIKGRSEVRMKDGGLVANNPAYLIYQEDSLGHADSAYEIYSFGTGYVPEQPGQRDAGYSDVNKVISDVFAGQVSAVVLNCQQELKNPRSGLRYFVRMQNLLHPGMGEMDDTSPAYIAYALKMGFELTTGQVFQSMLEQLGLENVPSKEEIENQFIPRVRQKLYSISSITYEELTDLEKEFLIKKVMERDFDAYEHLCTLDGSLIDVTNASELLNSLKDDLINQRGILDRFWNTEVSYAMALIDKGIAAHADAQKLPKITFEQAESLKNNNGTEFDANSLMHDMRDFCDSQGMFDHKNPHLTDIIEIFVRNIFSDVENVMTDEGFINLYFSLFNAVQEEANNKSYITHRLAQQWYSSRGHALKNALKNYLKRRYPQIKIEDNNSSLIINLWGEKYFTTNQ